MRTVTSISHYGFSYTLTFECTDMEEIPKVMRTVTSISHYGFSYTLTLECTDMEEVPKINDVLTFPDCPIIVGLPLLVKSTNTTLYSSMVESHMTESGFVDYIRPKTNIRVVCDVEVVGFNSPLHLLMSATEELFIIKQKLVERRFGDNLERKFNRLQLETI